MTGFERAFQNSLNRAAWLLREALAGRPAHTCKDERCRWAAWEHIYAPDCGPR